MLQNKTPASIKENYLFTGTDLNNIKVNINQKEYLEKKEGDIVYQKGDNAEYIYLIIEGEIKLKVTGVFTSPIVVKSGRNEFFGEKELLENTVRTTSAVANTDCVLYRIDRASLNALVRQDKIIKKNLYKTLQFDEPEGTEGQKDFFIKPEDSPEKFTFIQKEEVKKPEDKINESSAVKNESIEAVNPFEEIPKQNKLETDKDVTLFQYESNDKNLNWDFSSSPSPDSADKTKVENKVAHDVNPEQMFQGSHHPEVPNVELPNKEFTNEEKSDLFKRLAGFIEKDIKYPALTLKFYAEQIKKKEISKEINEVVDLLIEQANIIADTVEVTYNFSEDKLSLNLESLSINTAFDEILGLLADYVESQNCRLYKKYETSAIVNIDKRQFYQAIFQVMKNACEAMPGGGNIYVVLTSESGHIKIEIKNSGKSIPKELHEKIFEPFFSYGKSNSAGLGLAIADSIIKNHGGSIMVYSGNDETRFTISIPVAG